MRRNVFCKISGSYKRVESYYVKLNFHKYFNKNTLTAMQSVNNVISQYGYRFFPEDMSFFNASDNTELLFCNI